MDDSIYDCKEKYLLSEVTNAVELLVPFVLGLDLLVVLRGLDGPQIAVERPQVSLGVFSQGDGSTSLLVPVHLPEVAQVVVASVCCALLSGLHLQTEWLVWYDLVDLDSLLQHLLVLSEHHVPAVRGLLRVE